MSVQHAKGSDEAVHGLPYRLPSSPELTVMRSRRYCEILAAHGEDLEFPELPVQLRRLCLSSDSLQDLAQNDIRERKPLPLQVRIKPFRVGGVCTLEVVDPDRGIDNNHS